MAARVSAAVAFEWPRRRVRPRAVAVYCQLNRTGQLGRQRHQADMALGGLEKIGQGGNVGRQQVFCWLHPALEVRKKRAFQMNAEGRACPATAGRASNFASPESDRRVASSGAVTVVAR